MAVVSTLEGAGGLEFLVEITIGGTVERIAFFGISTPNGHYLSELISITGIENRIGVIPGSMRPQQLTLKIDDSSRRWSELKAANAFIGAAVEIKWGDPSVGISDFERIAGGRVSGWSRGKVTLDLQVEGDSAAQLDSPFPWIADQTAYPNIPEGRQPALVPIAYGDLDTPGGTVPAVRIGNLLASVPLELYIVHDNPLLTPGDLWRINPLDPDDQTGNYGLVGALPPAMHTPQGLAFDGDGELLCIEGGMLWRINTDDPDDETGIYGLIGNLPSGAGTGSGLAISQAGEVYLVNRSGGQTSLWRINPDDPDDETGDFGRVGFLPNVLPRGLAFHPDGDLFLLASAAVLYEVDIADPPNSTEVGTIQSMVLLPAVAFDPNGIGYAAATGTPLGLIRFNIEDPSDVSGDFGVVGDLPAGITSPLGMAFSGPHTNEWIASIGTATPASAWYTDRSSGEPVELDMTDVENKTYNGTDLTTFRLGGDPGVEVRWNGQGIDLESPSDQWKDLLEKLDIETDDDSFAAAKTALSDQGVSGNIIVSGLRETLRSVSRDIGRSFGMESYIARSGSVGVSVAVPEVTPASPVSIVEADVLAGSLSMRHPGYYLTGATYQFSPQFGHNQRTYLEQNTIRDSAELAAQGRESLETLLLPYLRDSDIAKIVINARLFFAQEGRILTQVSISPDKIRTLTIGSVIELTHSLGIGTNGWDEQLMRVVGFGIEVDRTRLAGRLQLVNVDEAP